ncbi:hypothetical protein LA2_00880 [Lactobacillus amylovorus GRL 1112]|uniref:Uncharacterized protein n=1 Tax=Lactobacillus amylovorus (strain GRL 1112) TaxID=695560 RepID=E4SK29_LACAR|nr:hypothetical protein [Lactobacillus amylovorus]ADQ58173.1 hypothetical protein LA2_00880 [Lactobacillus amylovorus GRL 1112]
MQKLDVGALDTTGVDRIAQTFAMDHNLVEIDGLAKLLLAETPVTPAQPITAPVKPENKPNKTKDNGKTVKPHAENATNRHGRKYAPAAAVKNTTKPQGKHTNQTTSSSNS